jgi:salicylate hydroxylase
MWNHLETPTFYNSHICLLGDSAHASTPHQAANAGQALEDAAVLSHMLGLVTAPSEIPLAFKAYDGVRRPRAQKVVTTSLECGRVYALMSEETGDDREKIVKNLRQRWQWIWGHDLSVDVRKAEDEFRGVGIVKT